MRGATAQFGGGSVHISGNFPERVEIAFADGEPDGQEFPVVFRAPWGSTLKSARVNGTPVEASIAGDGFHRVTRAWKPGDVLALEFDCAVKSHVQTGGGKRWVAFSYGPYALAQETRGEDAVTEPFAGVDSAVTDPATRIERVSDGSSPLPRFRIQGTDIDLVPFHLAGSKTTGPRTYFGL